MSRIGRLPIAIPAGVTVSVANNVVTVKGPLGELTQEYKNPIEIKVEGSEVVVTRPNDLKENRSLHGLYRTLVFNMIEGVTKGYEKTLQINGVGFKAVLNGTTLVLNIGFSHNIEVEQPEGIKFELINPTTVKVSGIDKAKVGHTAASIKAYRKPDPYHAYGIKYSDEVIVRKEGKKAGK